jgi:FkbM family methyltransferase
MKNWIANRLVVIYQRIFARRFFARWNKLLFQLSLRGLGVLNYGNSKLTGEARFLKAVAKQTGPMIVLDVGAHEGAYASELRALAPAAEIYAFEPHPKTYERLKERAGHEHFAAYNAACGSSPGRLTLYDYGNRPDGSQHASLHRDVIERIHHGSATSWEVKVIALDDFIEQQGLKQINLLKIDTEGHEYEVLLGSRRAIERGLIDTVHIEFNEMNVISRVFCRDFYELLKDYDFFRMLPDGLLALGPYWSITCELFAYQNLVAIRRKPGGSHG